ncbi:MAG: hypothetical protein H6550_05735 [Chitinophagales bacterium]|nr:hypothetical protein [Chitinophagales bacterium]
MNPRHLQFCLNYLQTHDPGVAYKMTYPKASTKSLYAAASRLMARPDVSAWIHETEQRVHERALREIEEEQGSVLKEQLLTINQKRAVLTKIITGETKRVRHIKTKYSYEKVEDDLPIYAVLRAIDMDTRLENFYRLLSDPATWRRTQTVYVNTPTLQQQVNVLISQTTEQTPTARLRDEVSASSDTQEATSRNTISTTHEETQNERSPDVKDERQTPFRRGPLAPSNSEEMRLPGMKSRYSGRGIGGQPPAPDKTPPLPIVNLNEKNMNQLTLLNNRTPKQQTFEY